MEKHHSNSNFSIVNIECYDYVSGFERASEKCWIGCFVEKKPNLPGGSNLAKSPRFDNSSSAITQRPFGDHSENTQRSLRDQKELREHSEKTQKTLRKHSENTQKTLREHSENTQKTLRKDSEKTQRAPTSLSF